MTSPVGPALAAEHIRDAMRLLKDGRDGPVDHDRNVRIRWTHYEGALARLALAMEALAIEYEVGKRQAEKTSIR